MKKCRKCGTTKNLKPIRGGDSHDTIVDYICENCLDVEISNIASIMGRKGGSSKSKAKQKSSRENGKLGGRLRTKKNPPFNGRA